MFYIIYQTTNLINGKIYIGFHKTKNPDKFDGYLGSGEALLHAIKRHGYKNFERKTLFIFDNPDDAYAKEYEIVNEDFVKRRDTYNIAIGGANPRMLQGSHTGNPKYKKSEEEKKLYSEMALARWRDPEYRARMLEHLQSEEKRKLLSEKISKIKKSKEWIDKINKNPEKIRKTAEKHKGMKRSDEAKRKMSEARKKAFANGYTVHNKIELPTKEDLYFLLKEKKLKRLSVAKIMNVSLPTLDKWIKEYGI